MIRNYIKLSLKILGRRKFFTFVNLFGIGFTLLVLILAAAFLDHIFSAYPPETRGNRTLAVFGVRMQGPESTSTGPGGYGFFDRYTRDIPGVERMTILSQPQTVISYWNGQRLQSIIKKTDADFFRVLDFEFLEGEPFGVADVAEGRGVAVINESTRRKFFGAESAVGKTLEADGQTFRVVGVVPDVPIFRLMATGDLYVPVTTSKSDQYRTDLRGGFYALYLLTDAGQADRVQEEFKARVARVPVPPEFERIYAVPETFFASFARMFANDWEGDAPEDRLLSILMIGALLFMVLPAVNLVNLNVSRSLERASEIGIRRAFGASATNLVFQFLFENIVLSIVGGIGALLVAAAVLGAFNSSGLIPYAHFAINPRIALWGFLFALAFGVVSGVWPAWRLSRLKPVQALAGGSR